MQLRMGKHDALPDWRGWPTDDAPAAVKEIYIERASRIPRPDPATGLRLHKFKDLDKSKCSKAAASLNNTVEIIGLRNATNWLR